MIKVEFIESYIKVGNDYQWNDNHGELIRCKDCKHQGKEYHEDSRRKDGGYYVYWCEKVDGYSPLGFDNQYCSEAERKEE